MIKEKLNNNWNFREKDTETFQTVTIPHTVNIEPLEVYKNKQGIFEYEREFTVKKEYENQRVMVKFEAVMMNCKVFLNDKFVTEHFGGYLPFSIDATDIISYDNPNKLYVLVDNRDDKETPPGKPTEGLDFLYYGGIYRNVSLEIHPQIYLTDSTDSSVKWGGVRIDTAVDKDKAIINIKQNAKSYFNEQKDIEFVFEIYRNNEIVGKTHKKTYIKANSDKTATSKIEIENPELWDTENPNMYVLKTKLVCDNKIIDEMEQPFGIRTVSIEKDGFYLNGKKTKLFGFNRGQQFPYLGISVSDEANRREARLIKNSHVNCIRLSHYPQSPAFIEECDRLGIMVIDPVPGWQFLGNDVWKNRLRENLVDLVHRDRNHPSVIIFEVTPNETNWANRKGDLFLNELHKIVKEECPCALTGGDNVGRWNSLTANFDVPYYGKDCRGPISHFFKPDNRMTLKREYGDWCFGGNESTSRTSRGAGEKAMQIQTWNFQFDHNSTYAEGNVIGDLIWEGIDHNRGYFPDEPISKSGVFDIFRVPKLSYQFVRSQAKPIADNDYVLFLNALVWQNKSKLVFYSNCDTVKLYADSKLIGDRKCDKGEDKLFTSKMGKKVNDNYWMTEEDQVATSVKLCPLAKHTISCMFDGGNCKHIDYPPFTFTNLSLDNVSLLEVEGYVNNRLVATKTYSISTTAKTLKIEPQTQNIPLKADDNDFIFVYVNVLDENDILCVDFNENVSLSVENGEIIGHSTIKAENGIAPFMVKANDKVENIVIVANSNNICENSLPLKTE